MEQQALLTLQSVSFVIGHAERFQAEIFQGEATHLLRGLVKYIVEKYRDRVEASLIGTFKLMASICQSSTRENLVKVIQNAESLLVVLARMAPEVFQKTVDDCILSIYQELEDQKHKDLYVDCIINDQLTSQSFRNQFGEPLKTLRQRHFWSPGAGPEPLANLIR